MSPYPLLFFGGDIGTFKDEGQDMISVDDWIQFKASPDVASTVHVSLLLFQSVKFQIRTTASSQLKSDLCPQNEA